MLFKAARLPSCKLAARVVPILLGRMSNCSHRLQISLGSRVVVIKQNGVAAFLFINFKALKDKLNISGLGSSDYVDLIAEASAEGFVSEITKCSHFVIHLFLRFNELLLLQRCG